MTPLELLEVHMRVQRFDNPQAAASFLRATDLYLKLVQGARLVAPEQDASESAS